MTHTPDDLPPARTAEIDRLARAAQQMAADTLPDGLWGPVLELEHWWMVVEPTTDGISPCATAIEGVNSLLLFTSRARAEAAQPTLHSASPTSVAAVKPAYVVDRSPIYSGGGVQIALFDCHDVGFFAPMDKLHALWRRHRGTWAFSGGPIPEPIVIGQESAAADERPR